VYPRPALRVPSKLRKKIDWLFRRAEGALLPEAVQQGPGAHLDPDLARVALRSLEDDLAIAGDSARWDALLRASREPGPARDEYVASFGLAGVRRFEAGPAVVYRLEIETFPRHVNNVYLVVEAGESLLFDCGSSLPTSRRDLALGFAVLREMFGEATRWEDVDWCLVSHAHGDHFGGLNHLRRTSRARVAIHELDARVIEAFDERIVLATKDLEAYWRRAGVEAAQRDALSELYAGHKRLFRAERVDRKVQDGDRIGKGYVVHHVPGHCPGLVCLQVHDVMLTSDHVLARITPHQFPQAIAPFAGLGHYFRSLEKIRAVPGIAYALGGHEEPIADLGSRIGEIEAFHRARLERVLAICDEPRTVSEIAAAMFGEQEGYGVILALDEAGAHVEYLHELGRVRVANLDEVAAADAPVPRYVRSDGAGGSRPAA
jgi:glyoxylase-like metal-dependent hydrolase (beta-lactamase superfamily II)